MEFHNEKPIYLQIADIIFEQVLLEQLHVGDKIASVREMAVTLRVNPNTVARTYAFLEEKHIIQLQRGVGYFVADTAKQSVRAFKKNEFLTAALPQLFKTMDLLELNFADLKTLYDNRGQTHEKK